MSVKVLGIVGSYRKGGIIDTLVDEALLSAQRHGAETTKIYLIDKGIEFCTNCRTCTQEPGPQRGRCVHEDDMAALLEEYDRSHGLVLGARSIS